MTKLHKAFLAVAVTAVITHHDRIYPRRQRRAAGEQKITHIGLMVQDMSNPFFSAMEKERKAGRGKIGATLNVQDAQVDPSKPEHAD